jgi:hypothetical protein
MHYEVRGIFEEHGEAIVHNAAKDVARNEWLRANMSKDELETVSVSAAFNRLSGYYKMYCLIKGMEMERPDDLTPEFNEIIEENYEAMLHSLDKNLNELRKMDEQEQQSRSLIEDE